MFGVILSTSIPAIAANFNRTKSAVPAQPAQQESDDEETNLEKELRRRAEVAEQACTAKDSVIRRQARCLELYERVLVKDGHDPDQIAGEHATA